MQKDETRNPKKPYIKPDFEYEEMFETTALACAKNNNGKCYYGGRKS